MDSTETSQTVLVDPSALVALRSISPTDPDEFIKTLVNLFISQTVEDLKNLKDAQAQKDVKRLGQVAHKMGSAAKQLGAFRLGNRAHALEQMAKQNATFETVNGIADQVFQDFAETKTYFEANAAK
jgi:HPt (histidine-containing phosphotransfer) domain-containing protein